MRNPITVDHVANVVARPLSDMDCRFVVDFLNAVSVYEPWSVDDEVRRSFAVIWEVEDIAVKDSYVIGLRVTRGMDHCYCYVLIANFVNILYYGIAEHDLSSDGINWQKI